MHRWSRWLITFCTWRRRLDPLRGFGFSLLVFFFFSCENLALSAVEHIKRSLCKKQALKESKLLFYPSCVYIYRLYLANTCVFALFSENVNDHVDENELLLLFFFLEKTWGCTLSSLATVQMSKMAAGSSSPRLLALRQYCHKCPTVAPVNKSLRLFSSLALHLCCKWLAFNRSPANL